MSLKARTLQLAEPALCFDTGLCLLPNCLDCAEVRSCYHQPGVEQPNRIADLVIPDP